MIGLVGACLFYGDSVITPAISVLSSVEGLELSDPGLASLVVPLSAVILAALFVIQARGTQRIGSLFGPVMVFWFVVIGVAGPGASPFIQGCWRHYLPPTPSPSSVVIPIWRSCL